MILSKLSQQHELEWTCLIPHTCNATWIWNETVSRVVMLNNLSLLTTLRCVSISDWSLRPLGSHWRTVEVSSCRDSKMRPIIAPVLRLLSQVDFWRLRSIIKQFLQLCAGCSHSLTGLRHEPFLLSGGGGGGAQPIFTSTPSNSSVLLNLAPQAVSGSACKCGEVSFSAVKLEESELKVELCPRREIVLWYNQISKSCTTRCEDTGALHTR